MRSFLGLLFAGTLYGQFPAGESALSDAQEHFKDLIKRGIVRAAGFVEIDPAGTNTAVFGGAQSDSLWRGASTTKAFTALAILRLAETGRLNLDAEANRYLRSFQLPKGANRGITIRDLLGHESGLDDPFVDSAYLSGAQPPLSVAMSTRVPRLVFDPGEARLYSNYGYGILGAVIEDVTGEPYDSFMQREVLNPVGMRSSTFLQPLPMPMEAKVVSSLERSALGVIRPGQIFYHRSASGGGLTTTLRDLATFAEFIRSGAKVGSTRLISRNGLQQALGLTDDSPGYGFATGINRGQRYWYAGGDLGGYHTVILWFPEHDRALVVVAASYSEMSTWGLVPKVMKKWFGEPKPAPIRATAPARSVPGLGDVAGTYRPVRYPHDDLGKTFTITMDRVVRISSDRSITYQGEQWQRVSDGRFRSAAGENLTFSRTQRGQLLLNKESELVPWYATGRVAIGGYFGFVLLSLSVLWLFKGRPEYRMLRWTASGVLIHSIAWLAAVLVADPQRLILGLPWFVSITRWGGWLCCLPWLLLATTAARDSIHFRSNVGRASVLLAAAIAFFAYFPFLRYWRVL